MLPEVASLAPPGGPGGPTGSARSSVRRRIGEGPRCAVLLARFGVAHQRRVASDHMRDLQGGKRPNDFAADR